MSADHIAVQPGHQSTRLRASEERNRHALHVVKHLGSQVVDQALTDSRGVPATYECDTGIEYSQTSDQQGADGDHLAVARCDSSIDDPAEEQRRGYHHGGIEDQGDDQSKDEPAVWTGISKDSSNCCGIDLALHDRVITSITCQDLMWIYGGHPTPSMHSVYPQDTGSARISGLHI